MRKLNLVSVKISNVLGIQELELTPEGNVIQISGKNGSGKTSTIEAIKNAIGVSNYSTLLREGESVGEVVLDLGEMVIKKTHKPNGETLTLKSKIAGTDKMSSIGSPASVLKSLVNPNSIDPVRLLTAKPKDLLDAVLSAIPMNVDAEKFKDLVGERLISTDQHALVAIAEGTKLLMEDRKLINRDIKTAKITKEQLAATLPDDIPLTEELEAEIESNNNEAEKIRSKARSAAREAKVPIALELDKLFEEQSELTEQMAALREKFATVSNQISNKQQELETVADTAREETLAKAQEYLESNVKLSKELSNLNVYKNTQNQVKDWERKESSATLESNDLSERLVKLQKYKEDLCDNLPIEGLAITDGRLTLNGIPFETLNTASRVKLVIELAKLTAGDIGLIVLDNSECMDQETYDLFLEEAAKTDLIFIVARVENKEFSVK